MKKNILQMLKKLTEAQPRTELNWQKYKVETENIVNSKR